MWFIEDFNSWKMVDLNKLFNLLINIVKFFISFRIFFDKVKKKNYF